MKAECQCGRLTVELPSPTPAVVACHCTACQRRTGSPFGLMAYYPAEQLTIAGEAQRYERHTDEGNTFETFFCTTCGSTVYARAGKHPAMIGVAVGTIADPDFWLPVRSVWEQTMHRWITVPGDVQNFPKGEGSFPDIRYIRSQWEGPGRLPAVPNRAVIRTPPRGPIVAMTATNQR